MAQVDAEPQQNAIYLNMPPLFNFTQKMTDSQSIRTKKEIKICELVIKFIKHKSVCGLGSSKLKRIMHISYYIFDQKE